MSEIRYQQPHFFFNPVLYKNSNGPKIRLIKDSGQKNRQKSHPFLEVVGQGRGDFRGFSQKFCFCGQIEGVFRQACSDDPTTVGRALRFLSDVRLWFSAGCCQAAFFTW